ncbi:MAG: hypothetical protein Q8L56_01220 [Rhodocyclaceae bacterium]|nr:hypothetical protein [Rhodocyclaceae bacterium]
MPRKPDKRAFSLSNVVAGGAVPLAAVLLLSMGGAHAASPSPPVAGLQPDRRPALPVIDDVARPAEWYQRAFSGVETPYPWTLRFVNDQGNWHNPFMAPGMTGRYDIRGWHRHGGVAEGGK